MNVDREEDGPFRSFERARGRKRVAVATRSPSSKNEKAMYYRNVADLLDYLVRAWKADVFLVPHTRTGHGWESNDVADVSRIRELVESYNHVTVMPFLDSPEHLVAFYGRMDLVISSRTHGIVLSRPTPVLAIPMVLKERFLGILEALELSDYCSQPSDPLNQKSLVDRILVDGAEIRARQEVFLNELQLDLKRVGKELREIAEV